MTSCAQRLSKNYMDIYNNYLPPDQTKGKNKLGLIEMPSILSDLEIQELIKESKLVPGLRTKYKRKIVGAHYKYGLSVVGVSGKQYYLYCCESVDDPDDFSVGLGYEKKDNPKLFLLRRYNSPDFPPHENPLEEEFIEGYHIHTATERYQNFGKKQEEKYAVETKRYDDSDGALACLLSDCGILEDQTTLGDWGERHGY